MTPTGSLYGAAGGAAPAIDALVVEDFDRAAPRVSHCALDSNSLTWLFGSGSGTCEGGLRRSSPRASLTSYMSQLAGNYAPSFLHALAAKKAGFAITLHLDSATRTQIDEFSTSNFLAIKKQTDPSQPKTLVVPTSESILKSVTTKTIIQIAEDFGWTVERRAILFQEVKDGVFEEVAACGTAAAVSHAGAAPTGPQR